MALTVTERMRVEEAVKTLARYNKSPFITNFLKQQSKPRIPPRYDKDELCDLIKQVLLGEYLGKKKYVLYLDELITHLDQLQETGRQHLYLFRLPEKECEQLLVRLRDMNEVKAMLGGEEELYKGGRLIWDARDEPQLALVRHDMPEGTTQPRSLLLKWVETRTFWSRQEETTGSLEFKELNEDEKERQETEDLEEVEEEGESQQIQIRVRREERATTFLTIDLENGDCELRIQALHGHARIARQQQLSTYRALVAKLFGFELVGPTVLAPAIRRTLIAREVQIVRCSAILPSGGLFTGGKGELPPVDVRELQAGVTIRFIWPQPSGGIVRVELDGRLDEIFILRPLLPDQHRLLLERIRHWRQEGLALFTSPKESKPAEGGLQPIKEGVATEPDTITPVNKKSLLEILRVALVGGIQPKPPTEPGIDRATREYARTHAMEETDGDTSTEGETESLGSVLPPMASSNDERALEQFLTYIREVAQSENSTYQREVNLVRNEELWNFRLSIIAAVLALTIVATGAGMLLFFPTKLIIGSITAVLGVLTGRGTVLIRSYAKSLETKRELIQDQQRDSHQTLIAIQTALSIPDHKARSRAMTRIASSLLGRVTGIVSSSKQPPLSKQTGE